MARAPNIAPVITGTPMPAILRGRAYTEGGASVVGAKVIVLNAEQPNGSVPADSAVTGEDGFYVLPLPKHKFALQATCETDYHGRHYRFWLDPMGLARQELDPFTRAESAQQDFVWRITSRTPQSEMGARQPESFFGGFVYLETMIYNPHMGTGLTEGQAVEIALAPDGPLIDGSAGMPVIFKVAFPWTPESSFLKDIPIGRYLASAKLAADGKPLQVASMPYVQKPGQPAATLGPTALIEFPPAMENPRTPPEGVAGVRLFITP